MHIGVLIFATDYGIRMDKLARALEDRGFESLFVPEHTHIPASRRTPRPGGGELPKEYWHTHDSFVALSFAAAPKPGAEGLYALLARRRVRVVSTADWERIDAAEVKRGAPKGKPREKFTRAEEMLAVLD